jgi:hypothetical protein
VVDPLRPSRTKKTTKMTTARGGRPTKRATARSEDAVAAKRSARVGVSVSTEGEFAGRLSFCSSIPCAFLVLYSDYNLYKKNLCRFTIYERRNKSIRSSVVTLYLLLKKHTTRTAATVVGIRIGFGICLGVCLDPVLQLLGGRTAELMVQSPVLVELERWHGRDLLRLGNIAALVHIHLDQNGTVGVVVRESGKDRSNVFARSAPDGGREGRAHR